jgi:hypothetical protein
MFNGDKTKMACIIYLQMLQEKHEKAIQVCKEKKGVKDCRDCKLNLMCGLLDY